MLGKALSASPEYFEEFSQCIEKLNFSQKKELENSLLILAESGIQPAQLLLAKIYLQEPVNKECAVFYLTQAKLGENTYFAERAIELLSEVVFKDFW